MHSRILAFLDCDTAVLVDGRGTLSEHVSLVAPISGLADPDPPSPELSSSGFRLTMDTVSALRKRVSSLRAQQCAEVVSVEMDAASAKALEQLRMILQFLGDMGMTDEVSLVHREGFAYRLALLNLVDRAEGYLKWKFAHLACLCLRQTEFPTRPSWIDPLDRPDVLMGGATHRFIRRVVHERSYTFGWNVSQLKKGMPIVSDEAVSVAVAKTIAALSTDQARPPATPFEVVDEEPDWDDPNRGALPERLPIEDLVREVRRTARELYPPGWYKPQKIFTPSISGHFFTSRDKTGALGAIVRSRDLFDYELILQDSLYRPPKSFTPWRLPAVEELVDTCQGGARFCACCGWHPSDTTVVMEPNPSMCEVLLESTEYDKQNAHSRLNAVRAVGLKEPFKIRCITGGPEGKYYRTKYIQKATHSHLRRHPCASLIGETISADRLNRQLPYLGPGEFYVSGDYSAATDNLDPRLSEAIADEICITAGWDQEWRDLYVDTLVHHLIWNGGKSKPPTEEAALRARSVQQKWGQLMGSPTSFPVLCIANLGLTRRALELRKGQVIRLRHSGILINGDDIGFVTDDQGYKIWKSVTSSGGLEPSLGKNFCSTDFIVLNSTFFDISGNAEGERTLTYRPYINYGLLECRNENGTPIQDLKSSLVTSVDPRSPDIGSLACDLVRGHDTETQVLLLKRFISRWKPTLQKFCPPGMSWYLPRHLGGLGLPIVGTFTSSDGKERFSRCQRVLATYLSHDPERAEGLTAMSHISRSESLSLWRKISPKVRKIMSNIPYEWTKEPRTSRGEGSVTSTLLAEAYAELRPDDVVEVEDEKGEDRYLEWRRQYEQLFDHARRTTFVPMSDVDIISDTPWRKRYDDYTVVDYAAKVDLRQPPSRLSPNWGKPTITLVSERDEEVEGMHLEGDE